MLNDDRRIERQRNARPGGNSSGQTQHAKKRTGAARRAAREATHPSRRHSMR